MNEPNKNKAAKKKLFLFIFKYLNEREEESRDRFISLFKEKILCIYLVNTVLAQETKTTIGESLARTSYKCITHCKSESDLINTQKMVFPLNHA